MTLIWPFLVPLCLIILATNKPETVKRNMYVHENRICVIVVKIPQNVITLNMS